MSLERLEEHRRLWEGKPELRAVYGPWFDILLDGLPQGARVLEVGAGPGFLAAAARERRPDLRFVSSDLLAARWNDVVADASRLPFATGSVDAVLGLDVLHHLPDPAGFFREVARVLGGRGFLRLVEPWITPLGYVIYRYFHQEDCTLGIDPWRPFPEGGKDSFDGNAAVPWRLARDTKEWEWRGLGLEPPRTRRLNAFAYILSLGFREASLLPVALVRPLLALDRWTGFLAPLVGLRGVAQWESARNAGTPAPLAPTGGEGGALRPEASGAGVGHGLGRWLAFLALLLALGWAGVRMLGVAGRIPGERFQVARLLPGPGEAFDEESLYAETEVASISWKDRDHASGWIMGDGSPLPAVADGIRLPADRATQRVIGPLGPGADDVDVVELDVEQESPSGTVLLWPRPDGRFAADHGIAVLPGPGGVSRFVVAGHRFWPGGAARIAIQPSFSAQAVRLRAMRLLAYRVDPERARSAPRGPLRVALDGDTRTALAVVEGRPAVSSPVEVPAGARLRFALGLPEHVRAEARFVIGVETEAGTKARLFETDVRRADSTTGWSEQEVDLGPWVGRTVSFTVALEGEVSAPLGFWANPILRWPSPGDDRPNVLLISADTLRADHLSLYGYGRRTSPRLEQWARRAGVVFTSTVAPSPWTVPSHVSLFTGRDAHRHGVSRQGPIPRDLPVLAEQFRDAGYLTLGTTGGGLVAARFGFGRGFDVFRTRDHPLPGDARTELERGVAEATAWIDRHGSEPLFLFLHTYATHTPLEATEPWFSRMRGHPGPRPPWPLNAEPVPAREDEGFRRRYRFAWTKPLPDGAMGGDAAGEAASAGGLDLDDPRLGIDLYDTQIARLDDAIGRVLDHLRDAGLERRTIVVFTSDHGESFGENSLWSHTHLLDSNLMVPLVIGPRRSGWPKAVDHQVRLIDVAPTVLELAGLAPSPVADGRSLVPLLSGRTTEHPEEAWAYSSRTNWGLGLRVAGRLKMIVPNGIWPTLRGTDALYDLAADPGETRNLAATGDPRFAALRELVSREMRAIDRGVIVAARCERGPCFEATLGGIAAERDSVTSPDLSCDCISPVPGGTRLSLRPGDAFTLVYEDLLDGELDVEARASGPSGSRKKVSRPVGPGRTPFSLSLEPSGWKLGQEEAAPEVGLAVFYRGSLAEPHPEISREMQDRLRALGYIE